VKQLFEIREVDRKAYSERIRDFVPDRMIDVHTHLWLGRHRGSFNDPRRITTWPDRVAEESPIEELMATYDLMFPGKRVTPLVFGAVLSQHDDLEENNRYVSEAMRKWSVPGLIWSVPTWSGEELERRIVAGGFMGSKSYLASAPEYLPEAEIRIFDFFPPHQLDVLNRHGWIMLLHIPRPGRLRDKVNLAQMVEIEKNWPNIKVIIAHVGRAYCPEDVGDAFEALAETKGMMFDISANTSAENFEKLIRAVGPRRILFGSDLPISRMRMRRVCENGNYVNLVPRGLYGDVSGDSHMRDVDEDLTFFMYEEIDAFRRASEATGLGRGDIENVFYGNAERLIRGAMGNG